MARLYNKTLNTIDEHAHNLVDLGLTPKVIATIIKAHLTKEFFDEFFSAQEREELYDRLFKEE